MDDATEAKMQEPAGQALRRIVQEADFREGVAKDAPRALSGYDLSEEEVAALAADAEALSAEVSGFSRVELRTPGVMGMRMGPIDGPPVKASLACYNTNISSRPPVRASLACYNTN